MKVIVLDKENTTPCLVVNSLGSIGLRRSVDKVIILDAPPGTRVGTEIDWHADWVPFDGKVTLEN